MDYVHLHLHSEFSMLDGIGTIKEIVAKAVEQESSAVAVTDHGNVNSWISLYTECKAKGIKPIFGLEAYFSEDLENHDLGVSHLILLAKNMKGFYNLLEINAFAHMKGFYKRPTINFETLEEFREGVICLSGCAAGVLSKKIIKDQRKEEAIPLAKKFQKIFGEDYYIEMQVNDFDLQPKVNKGLMKIAEELEIKTVMTTDAHYVKKEDSILQKMMVLVKHGHTIKENTQNLKTKSSKAWEMHSTQYWMKNQDEMKKSWSKWHSEYMDEEMFMKSMKESSKIANKIESFELDVSPKYPKMNIEGDIGEYFDKQVWKGFKWRGLSKSDEKYTKQIEYEVGVLKKHGLEAYFLILSDAIQWARKNDIMVGVGRGSAAGSLVSYCLGITGINPIVHELMFERFISPARADMPDIDVDFESAGRDKVKEYVEQKYGQDHVGQIISFGMLKLKSAIKDVARVMDGDYMATNDFTSKLDDRRLDPADEDEPKVETMEDLREAYPEELDRFLSAKENHEEILKIAFRLKGRIRNISKHPAGVVITPRPLHKFLAIQRHGGQILVGWSEGVYRKQLTPFGFVKYDFLAIKTLDILKKAMKLIEKRHKETIDIEKIPLDDKKVFKAMSKGKSLGSFQFETDNMRRLLHGLKPDRFEDLSALNALDRPGPLDMGMDQVYADLKNGVENKKTKKMVKDVTKKIFKSTYGVILYQEQMVQAAVSLAGFSVVEANDLRKFIIKKVKDENEKKKKEKEIERLKELFVSRATKKIGAKDAEYLWESIYKFSSYGFNKAHSDSYAMIGYQCMWLKVNYPIEFFTAILSFSKKEKTLAYMNDARRYRIEVLPVSINESGRNFKIEGDNIRYPVGKLKGIKKAASPIVENQPYESLLDFMAKIKGKRVNKSAILSLINAGAFDTFGKRDRIFYKYCKMIAKKNEDPEANNREWTTAEEIEREKQSYEFEFSLTKVNKLFDRLVDEKECKNFENKDDWQLEVYRVGGIVRRVKEHKAKSGVMAFVDFQIYTHTTSVTIFKDRWERMKDKIKIGTMIYGDMLLNEYNGKRNFMLSSKAEHGCSLKVLDSQ